MRPVGNAASGGGRSRNLRWAVSGLMLVDRRFLLVRSTSGCERWWAMSGCGLAPGLS
ncbi:hypothetical protein [Pseudomonas psychrophila]|uniref:Uncharacterized protein n=1 Tax=Pseudomonas psychrophila TaxID=122355 RepID=A0A8I1FW85_9PSED|nr:hypothetical protein [Pseudomonas psychrophila]MBJ2259203.1 hypothetical protein [Pseudomonas psychrophila]